MAVINGVTNHVEHSVLQTVWSGLATNDTGSPEELSRYPVKAVQVSGTFGGAAVAMEGSEDGVSYFTMAGENPAGGADIPVSLTAAGRMSFSDNPRFLRPHVTGGAGSGLIITLTSRQFGH